MLGDESTDMPGERASRRGFDLPRNRVLERLVKLDGKVALVTGGGSGIGAAVARALAGLSAQELDRLWEQAKAAEGASPEPEESRR